MGGFGLLALQTQLEGGRAKWVQALLGDEWKEQRPYVALPLRLMRVIQDSMYPNGNTTCNPRSPFARLVTDPTSLVSTLRKWTGVASFFPLPPGTLAHRWSMAKWLSKCALPDRWKDYLQSWRDITNTKADVNRHWEERVLDGDLGLLGATNACVLLQIPSVEKNAMGSVHLVRQARTCNQYPLLCSPLPLTSHPSSKKGSVGGPTFASSAKNCLETRTPFICLRLAGSYRQRNGAKILPTRDAVPATKAGPSWTAKAYSRLNLQSIRRNENRMVRILAPFHGRMRRTD